MRTWIGVLVIAEPGLFRSRLAALLAAEPDLRVVAAADGDGGAAIVARRLAPQVVVLDLAHGGADRAELIRGVVLAAPSARVLVLTEDEDRGTVLPPLAAGAHGVLPGPRVRQELAAAVRGLARDGVFLPASATRLLCERIRVR